MIEYSTQVFRREQIEHASGSAHLIQNRLPTVKKRHYRIIKGVSVGGDAPKELICLYEFDGGKKKIDNPKNWDVFIAKTGHKWYPNESIMEHMLNRIGQVIGMRMAESKLCFINGQVRFLSKLFRNERHQILEHGAELYSGYLGDREFVEEIEEQQMARHFFTLTFTHDTFKYLYPHQAEDIFLDFARMLVFDAFIGNNDRHFYNWGVLKHLSGEHQPFFSPVYDTARALFWNRSDVQIKKYSKDLVGRNRMLQNYVRKSTPKIGIEKNSTANHFDIIKALYSDKFSGCREIVEDVVTENNHKRIKELILDEFSLMLIPERVDLILECIDLRYSLLRKEIES